MSNTIEKAKIFQTTLDEQLIQELTSSWMEANAGATIYNGGSEIKIPKMSMDGFGDYDRDTGYAPGSVTLSYETHTFDMDRSKKFRLDAMDVDESNFVANAGAVMAQFQRTEVAPETDAYRYSKIFSKANASLRTSNYVPATATIFEQLKNDIVEVQDVIGENMQLVVCMGMRTANILDQADKITKELSPIDFTVGNLSTKVRGLDNIPILRISSDRFKSAYTFGSDGYTADATAMDINWIIIARNAPVAIIKTDMPKIITPDVNQNADAWDVAIRKFSTLIIPDNKMSSVWVSYRSTAAPALTATVAAGTGTGNTKFTATAGAGNTLGYTINTTVADDGFFNTIPTITAYTSGDSIAGTAGKYLNMYEVDAAGRVQKFATHLLVSGDIA